MTQLPARVLPRPSALLPGLAAAVAGGLVTGGFGAWACYADRFNPLAHTFGLWITLVALLSAQRSVLEAAVRSVAGLAAAVLSFYIGQKVVYDQRYSPPLPFPADQIREWLVLALVAGVLLGWAFHRIGRDDRAGALATAAAVGLLVGDAFRRGWRYSGDGAVLAVTAALCVCVLLTVAVRSRRQLLAVLLWSVPMAAAGVLLVSLPDALEQVLLTGGP